MGKLFGETLSTFRACAPFHDQKHALRGQRRGDAMARPMPRLDSVTMETLPRNPRSHGVPVSAGCRLGQRDDVDLTADSGRSGLSQSARFF